MRARMAMRPSVALLLLLASCAQGKPASGTSSDDKRIAEQLAGQEISLDLPAGKEVSQPLDELMDTAEAVFYMNRTLMDPREGYERLLRVAASAPPASTLEGAVEGHEEAADALFLLSAVKSSGIGSLHGIESDQKLAAAAEKKAVLLGSTEARVALAKRLLLEHGDDEEEEGSCERAFDHLEAASAVMTEEAEREKDFAVPGDSALLRNRFRDGSGGFIGAESEGAHVELERDMAARGDIASQRSLGYKYMTASGGLERNPEQAVNYLRRAASRGDPWATFNLGFSHLQGLHDGANFEAAREHFQQAWNHGIPAASNGLGVLYMDGLGVDPNSTLAKGFFERAAMLGNPDGMYNLATVLYWRHDFRSALEQFQQASERGHWRAPYSLALMHFHGLGTRANCTRATQLLNTFLEERLGWSWAQDEAMEAFDTGDEWKALVLYTLIGHQGSATAQLNAAYVLIHGGFGQMGRELAKYFLSDAVLRDDPAAHVELAHLFAEDAQGEEALRHYRAAAKAGSSEGKFFLGWVAETGLGLEEPSYGLALASYRDALAFASDLPSAAAPALAYASLSLRKGLSKAKHMPVLGVALLGAWIVCAVCIALYFAQLDRRDRQRMRQQARHYHEIAPS